MAPAILAALLGLTVAACRSNSGSAGGTTAQAAAGTPVVLVSIDTLRADHLPSYGYDAVETPAIDALRRDAVLFSEAYSHTPLTLPSHVTMLTGLLPAASGVRDNVGYTLDRKRLESGELPHLARLLAARGYATAAGVSAYVLLGKSGIGSGFDLYEDSVEFRTTLGLGGMQRPGGSTLDKLEPWLEATTKAGKPFFLFFHLYEPHTPYAPPEPFASRYRERLYDGEIAAADAVVGRLLDALRRLGVYDRSLIVLVSDHGEGLDDHGEEEHGVLLYRETIHVPLLVKLPGNERAGQASAAPVGLMDVAPTVLDLLGVPAPAAMTGRSVLAAGTPDAPRRIYAETFYPRLHMGWSELFSLVDGRHHLIDGPDPELYDLTADAAERRNLRASERRLFAEMDGELERYDRELKPPAALDEETRQAMAALGYLGGVVATGGGPLPDPKSKIGTLADFRAGMRFLARKDYPAAAAALRRTVEANPKMADGWELLGQALQRLQDSDGAVAAYKKALEASGNVSHVAVSLASVLFSQGRLEDAETHARMAVATSPSFAHGLLAQIAKERGDFAAAEREATLALEDKGTRVGPLIALAEVYQAQGKLEQALAKIREAEAAYAEREAKDEDLLRGLELARGRTLADLGDAAAAEAAFEREISRFPDQLRAYSSLAILHALLGDPARAGAAVRRMVEANESPSAYVEAVKTYRVFKDERGAEKLLAFALARYPDSAELRRLRTESGLRAAPAGR